MDENVEKLNTEYVIAVNACFENPTPENFEIAQKIYQELNAI